MRERVQPQHFGVGFEDDLIGKDQTERQHIVRVVGHIYDHANAAAADVDGSFDELPLCGVGLGLNADR